MKDLDRMEAIFAFDGGATDSGVKDDEFKESLRKDKTGTCKLLEEIAKIYMNSEEYGLADVAELITWAGEELGIDY